MATSGVKLKLSIDGRKFNDALGDAGQCINKFGPNVAQAASKAGTRIQDPSGRLSAMAHTVTAGFAVGKLAIMNDAYAYADLSARVVLHKRFTSGLLQTLQALVRLQRIFWFLHGYQPTVRQRFQGLL